MLTEEELTAIREHNKCLTDNTGLVIVRGEAATIDRLLAEVRELRLLLRDAVQDATPGNRLWQMAVKATLEAAAKALERDACRYVSAGSLGYVQKAIRAIDPSTILPTKEGK